MQALAQNTTLKLSIEHNISSNKVIEARFDRNQSILAVKQNIEGRYGSFVPYMKLQLKDIKGNFLKDLENDILTLGQYGVENGMIIYVLDLNPNSIHKEIQNFEGVEKYMISQENYDKLPQNFRKWKKQFLAKHPQFLKQNQGGLPLQATDPQYLGQLASTIQVKSRCKLQNGARGKVQFVGKIMDLGVGYWVGIKLDEPYGDSDGIVKGVKYFEAANKYGIFVRPNQLEVGDFPQLDIDDQI